MQEEQSKWIKFGSIFAILIMVGAVFVGLFYGLDGLSDGDNTTYPFTDVPGTHANFTFKNAKDAANHIPDGVLAITILRVYENDSSSQTFQDTFPGANISKEMNASYLTGYLTYYSIENESNVSLVVNGSKPQYENYEGYNIIFLNPSQRVIAGSPFIIAAFFNYAADNTLAKKAIDVLAGKASGSSDLNDILAYADDTEEYDEIIVYKANTGSDYDKYYQRASKSIDGTTFQLTFQMESIILKPTDEMKQDVRNLAANATEGVEFTITEDGDVMKTYVDSSNYTAFRTDTNALYQMVSNHTKQSNTTATA